MMPPHRYYKFRLKKPDWFAKKVLNNWKCVHHLPPYAAFLLSSGSSHMDIGNPVASQIALRYFSALIMPFITRYIVQRDTPNLWAIGAALMFFLTIAIFTFCSNVINMVKSITNCVNFVKEKNELC